MLGRRGGLGPPFIGGQRKRQWSDAFSPRQCGIDGRADADGDADR